MPKRQTSVWDNELHSIAEQQTASILRFPNQLVAWQKRPQRRPNPHRPQLTLIAVECGMARFS